MYVYNVSMTYNNDNNNNTTTNNNNDNISALMFIIINNYDNNSDNDDNNITRVPTWLREGCALRAARVASTYVMFC